jgi:hypothetical protein
MSEPVMPKPYLTDPWFHVCLKQALDTWELVEQFDRLYGANLTRKGSQMEVMIDDSTGRTSKDVGAFVEFVYDCVYLRVPRPAEYPVPPWLREAKA